MQGYWKVWKEKNADEIHPMVKVQSYNDVIPRAVSVLYSALMEAKYDSTLYVKAKWEKEMSEKIPDNMCSCMVYFPHYHSHMDGEN